MASRGYSRDRRLVAYLFAVTSCSIALYLAIKDAAQLGYGVFLVLGLLVTSALLALGVQVDPRRFYDDPTHDRRSTPRRDREDPPVGGESRTRNERVSAALHGGRLHLLRVCGVGNGRDRATRQPRHA